MNTTPAHAVRGSVAAAFAVACLFAAAIASYAFFIQSIASTLAGDQTTTTSTNWDYAWAEFP